MPDPLVLDDFMAPTGFANQLHLDELRQPVSDSVRVAAVKLADLLMAMVPLREALPADLPRARDRPAAAGVDKYALLAAWRREAEAGFDALLARARPEARLATQAAILEVIAQRTAPLLERPRALLSRRWRRFERGCFLAALTHWSRERAAIETRGAIPTDVGATHRRALAARHKTEPWVRLFLAARRQFAAHQVPSDPAETDGPMAREIALALNILCAAHANLPRLTPPLIQRSLRAMHREMLGAVSESFGLLEMLRRLRMDFPTRARLNMQCPRLPRLRDHPKNGAAVAPVDPTVRTTDSEERERRNAALREMFGQPLRPLPPPPRGDAPDLCPGAERLADLLPPAERIVLGLAESRRASAGDLKRAEPSLTNLWGWFLEHRAYGYPRLSWRGHGREGFVTPERYWIKLLSAISMLYDGLGSAGFRAAGDLEDYPSHINVQTYIGHGAYSCDVHIALGTPVRMARPATLALTARAIGPAFAPGRYEAAAGIGVAIPINAAQEVWAKMMEGYFGRHFSRAWPTHLDGLLRGQQEERRQAILALFRAAGPPVRQFVLAARPDLATGLAAPSLTAQETDSLINTGAGNHPRAVDSGTFLAGLFFRDAVLDRRATQQTALRFQATARTRLAAALREAASWAEFAAAIRSLGWTGGPWAQFVQALVLGWSPSRGHPSSWREAALPNDAALIYVIGQIDAAATGVVPPAVLALRHLVSPDAAAIRAASVAINRALDLIERMTERILARPREGGAIRELHAHVLLFAFNPGGATQRTRSTPQDAELSSEAEVDLRFQTLPHANIDPLRPYAQGNWVQARYEYLGAERGGGSRDRLVVQLDFMHMTSIERVREGRGAAEPGLVTADSPLLGTIGSSGNASTPHAHMQIVVKDGVSTSGSLDRSPPLAVASIFDFLGHLPWLGPIATGPWPIR